MTEHLTPQKIAEKELNSAVKTIMDMLDTGIGGEQIKDFKVIEYRVDGSKNYQSVKLSTMVGELTIVIDTGKKHIRAADMLFRISGQYGYEVDKIGLDDHFAKQWTIELNK